MGPEFSVIVLAVLGQVIEQIKDLLHATAPDHLHVAGLLQDLARHIERQIGRINHPAHKAQIGRHQLACILHDEHALYIQLDAHLGLAIPQVKRRVRRDIKERGVILPPLNPDMGPGQRVFVIVTHMLVKGLVFLLRDVVLAARPQGIGAVGGLFLCLAVLLANEDHRQRHMIRILTNQRLDAPILQKIVLTLL